MKDEYKARGTATQRVTDTLPQMRHSLPPSRSHNQLL